MMSLISELMNCISWHIYLPCKTVGQDILSWDETEKVNKHVISSFETGISHYGSTDTVKPIPSKPQSIRGSLRLSLRKSFQDLKTSFSDSVRNEQLESELTVPVFKNGGEVCAVLQFVRKSEVGYHQEFSDQDVHKVKQLGNQIAEMLESNEITSFDWKKITSITRVILLLLVLFTHADVDLMEGL